MEALWRRSRSSPPLRASEKPKGPESLRFPSLIPSPSSARSRGLEPLTSGVTGSIPISPAVRSGHASLSAARAGAPAPVQPSQLFANLSSGFAASLLHSPAPVRVVSAVPARLLTAREAAEQLNVSASTVYALCESGALAHVRVSNAIRIRPEALAAFLKR